MSARKKEWSKKPSVNELLTDKKDDTEKVTRPVSFDVQYPSLYDENDMEVNVILHVHNGSKDKKGDVDNITFLYPREEVAPKLYAIDSLDEFLRVQEISKISKGRDAAFKQLNLKLTRMFDESNNPDRLGKYEDIVSGLFHNNEMRESLKKFAFMDTLLTLASNKAIFHSEEIQSLFA